MFPLLLSLSLAADPSVDASARAALALALASSRPTKPAPPVRSEAECYAAAYRRALTEGKPLYIGVACDPPMGDWVAVRVEALDGVQPGNSTLVIGHPNGHGGFNRQDFPVWETPRRTTQRPAPVVTEFVTPGAYYFQPTMMLNCGPSG